MRSASTEFFIISFLICFSPFQSDSIDSMSGQITTYNPVMPSTDSISTITPEEDHLEGKVHQNQPLQPPDGGRGWLVVFGSFLVSAT